MCARWQNGSERNRDMAWCGWFSAALAVFGRMVEKQSGTDEHDPFQSLLLGSWHSGLGLDVK